MMDEQVITPELWDRARWRGVAYGRHPSALPFMAFVYQNKEPATEIFTHWHDLVGSVDNDERIRIAIIEGDIPGQDSGYTVHVGPNTDRLVELARRQDGPEVLYSLTRLLRMNPSPHLEMFKQMIGQAGRYLLVAGALNGKGSFDINPVLTIEKTTVVFRHANDVSQTDDFDAIVLARPDGAKATWN